MRWWRRRRRARSTGRRLRHEVLQHRNRRVRRRSRRRRLIVRVGVLGATGAVGSTILEVLAERGFPADEVVAFASERSAGTEVGFAGSTLRCRALDGGSIAGLDLVLASAGGAVSADWAPRFVDAGAVVVDNTSYWRMHD